MLIRQDAFLRPDGRKGIRNIIVVAYLVECGHHVAREIAWRFRDQEVHLIGFSGCYPNPYAYRMMKTLCTHPNVGGALFVSLGCESFDRKNLVKEVAESGRPAEVLVIQQEGGTKKTIALGVEKVKAMRAIADQTPRVPMYANELIVGTVCGGSDATSGIAANPGIGYAFDLMVADGAACIFEETGELIGCEQVMAARAATPELAKILRESVDKAAKYYGVMGHGSFAVGNAEGGLTTIEEKSLGAYAKSGTGPIHGYLKPADVPPTGGLYLLDVVPDGEVRFGFPNINDTQEIGELIACGSHVILFASGRGSVVGSAISPVIKVTGNPETYARMTDDMDVNAGRILQGSATLPEIGKEIRDLTVAVAAGQQSKSEELLHQEFVMVYKSFEPLGPGCLPVIQSLPIMPTVSR